MGIDLSPEKQQPCGAKQLPWGKSVLLAECLFVVQKLLTYTATN